MELLQCIYLFSALNGIDPKVTQAVIKVESNYNERAIGSLGEVGLMQVRPEYVVETKSQLLDPCTNVKVGTALLRKAKESCKDCVDFEYVNAYNLGITAAKRLKFPKKWNYYVKVTKEMQ